MRTQGFSGCRGTVPARQPSTCATTVTSTVLLVEDDARIRQALTLSLADEGYQVLTAASGEDALRQLASYSELGIEVVLLDLMLPGVDGLTVCRTVRETSDLPIIMVTARTDTRDVIAGLEAGADDYVTKPLVASELGARIRALLRRARGGTTPSLFRMGALTVDVGRGLAHRDGEDLRLTKTEFRLLCELAFAGGQVVTREQLLERVWDYDYFADTRLLDVHIMRLRGKIEPDPGNPQLILTARGLGYRLATVS